MYLYISACSNMGSTSTHYKKILLDGTMELNGKGVRESYKIGEFKLPYILY